MHKQKVLAIITARGGSKGLPGKNIRELCGKPLIAWTIEQAKACEYIDEIFVSTDSAEIAKVAEKFGVAVPCLRPENLASDTASSADVVLHVIDYYEKNNQHFDYIILLQPTSPLRKNDDLKNSILQLMSHNTADGLISLGEVQTEHPLIVDRIDSEGFIQPYLETNQVINRRQELDPVYFSYGVIYIIKTSIFKEKKTFYTKNIIPYFIERWQNYDIDDLCDFLCTEAILQARLKGNL